MIHAPDSGLGLDWYQKAFPGSVRQVEQRSQFEYITIDDTNLEVVVSDAKVPSGAAGTVVYWHTVAFEKRLRFLLSIGATLFRGPMMLDDGSQMCQVLDPFGNPFGLRSEP